MNMEQKQNVWITQKWNNLQKRTIELLVYGARMRHELKKNQYLPAGNENIKERQT